MHAGRLPAREHGVPAAARAGALARAIRVAAAGGQGRRPRRRARVLRVVLLHDRAVADRRAVPAVRRHRRRARRSSRARSASRGSSRRRPGTTTSPSSSSSRSRACCCCSPTGGSRRRAERAAWFAVGLLIWFQLVARWPSAVAIVPLAAIAFFWTGASSWRNCVDARGAALAGGGRRARSLTQLFLAPVPDIIRGIHQGNTDATAALGYSRSHLLSQYVTNLSDLVARDVTQLLVPARRRGRRPGCCSAPAASRTRPRSSAAAGLVLLTPALHPQRARARAASSRSAGSVSRCSSRDRC